MFKAILAALLLGAALPAHAADATGPARELMKAATANWSEAGGDEDYTSEDRMGRLYGPDFAAVIEEAVGHASRLNKDTVLGYDMITGAEDGCPLKDLKITQQKPETDFIPVIAQFKPFTCLKGDARRNMVVKALFMMGKYDGVYKIDEIFRTVRDNEVVAVSDEFNAVTTAALFTPKKASAGPKELMEAAAGSSDDMAAARKTDEEASNYFSERRLGKLYTQSFVNLYRAAWKKQEADENGGYLLGADPVIGGQDNCPLKDLSIETKDPDFIYVDVIARFRAVYCFGNPGDDKRVTTVKFVTILEGGAFKIDDIQHMDGEKVVSSLKADLEALGK
ncbi:hypothetical protein [Rhizobium sp. TRM95796]|uniref:hypothetical protein n=1 Tax=Rhizobium sp. TRM95796 TaxID=2979862 RepID=UPI0021E7C621|nr:hypothetical protein [Rhizobium sp. TRM95796]MCV3765304.1 hypothetical protein [Rhizobium sp. TRM95796]